MWLYTLGIITKISGTIISNTRRIISTRRGTTDGVTEANMALYVNMFRCQQTAQKISLTHA